MQKDLEGGEQQSNQIKNAKASVVLRDKQPEKQDKIERKDDLESFKKSTESVLQSKSSKENELLARKFQDRTNTVSASNVFQFKKGISVQKSLEQDSFKRKKKIFEYKNENVNQSSSQSSHMSKLRMLDQKISEITNKLHQTIAESK